MPEDAADILNKLDELRETMLLLAHEIREVKDGLAQGLLPVAMLPDGYLKK
jgi:hypothetical protein